MADIPHFRFPFARSPNTGRVVVVEQDTGEHVVSCENVVLRCPAGFRLDRPEFGVRYPEYASRPDATDIVTGLRRWEPRSEITGSVARDFTDRAAAIVTVEVHVDTSMPITEERT
jgi:phage baseplate assembly protein W